MPSARGESGGRLNLRRMTVAAAETRTAVIAGRSATIGSPDVTRPMLTDQAIRVRLQRQGRVFLGLVFAAMVFPAACASLVLLRSPWQGALDELVANGASGGRIALHMAIPVLPAIPVVAALLAYERWRHHARCEHCNRSLGGVTLATGACWYCGRQAVIVTEANRIARTRRFSKADTRGSAPDRDLHRMTIAEFTAALRQATWRVMAGMVGTLVGLALLCSFAVWLKPEYSPAAPPSALLQAAFFGTFALFTLGPMMLGCVLAERCVPRCPTCRTAAKGYGHEIIATGRCGACSGEFLRREETMDHHGPLRDRALFNRGADLYWRVRILPCILGGIVGFGVLALVWRELEGDRWWLGLFAPSAMLVAIFATAMLLPRLIDRHVARGHATCPSCKANLLHFRHVVGGTANCCRCGGAVFEKERPGRDRLSPPPTPGDPDDPKSVAAQPDSLVRSPAVPCGQLT